MRARACATGTFNSATRIFALSTQNRNARAGAVARRRSIVPNRIVQQRATASERSCVYSSFLAFAAVAWICVASWFFSRLSSNSRCAGTMKASAVVVVVTRRRRRRRQHASACVNGGGIVRIYINPPPVISIRNGGALEICIRLSCERRATWRFL